MVEMALPATSLVAESPGGVTPSTGIAASARRNSRTRRTNSQMLGSPSVLIVVFWYSKLSLHFASRRAAWGSPPPFIETAWCRGTPEETVVGRHPRSVILTVASPCQESSLPPSSHDTPPAPEAIRHCETQHALLVQLVSVFVELARHALYSSCHPPTLPTPSRPSVRHHRHWSSRTPQQQIMRVCHSSLNVWWYSLSRLATVHMP